jgi:D-glycero-alpha-D-manno-heptose 1-phosphate guanylyltransferase
MPKKEALVLAGGFGTRLQTVVNDVPKPMAPINNKPFLEYLLSYLHKHQYQKIILSTGYLAEKISEHFGNSFLGMQIEYCVETTPLGTGGAIKLGLQKCAEQNVLVLNGDSFFDVNLFEFEKFHTQTNSNFSLAVRQVENADRYGTITLSGEKITEFKEKDNKANPGIINGGVYLIEKNFYLNNCPESSSFSVEKDFLEKFVEKFRFCAYQSNSYFIDIGIPNDFNRAQHEFKGFKY